MKTIKPITISENIIVHSLWSHTCSGGLKQKFTEEEFNNLTGWKHSETSITFAQLVQTGQLIKQGEEYMWGTSTPGIKEYIKLAVSENPGISGIKLAAILSKQAIKLGIPAPDAELMHTLVVQKELRAVELLIPGSEKVQFLFFPAGTQLSIL